MGFSRQEYWSGLPFHLRKWQDTLPAEPQGKPKNTGVHSLSLPQGIFPTQELNWGLLHCRWILYQLSSQGRPIFTYFYLKYVYSNFLFHTSVSNFFQEMWLICIVKFVDKVINKIIIIYLILFIYLFIYFYFTILYWFCHTSTYICHGCTRVPHPEPPSHLPAHTIPLGHPSAPAPSFLYPPLNLDWWFVSYMILYMF